MNKEKVIAIGVSVEIGGDGTGAIFQASEGLVREDVREWLLEQFEGCWLAVMSDYPLRLQIEREEVE